MDADRAPVLREPLVDWVPLQPPDAVHVVAFDELQLSTAEPPVGTTVEFVVSTTVGSTTAGTTSTVTLVASLLPPGPVQTIEYVALAATEEMICEPLAALAPLQPPDASQAVAFKEIQVSTTGDPEATSVGSAVSVADGTTFTVTLVGALVPPGPEQLRTNVVAADNPLVTDEPLVPRAPFQPPEAAHAVAFVEVQVNVEVAALATVLGPALSVTVGAEVPSLPPQDASHAAPSASHREDKRILFLGGSR